MAVNPETIAELKAIERETRRTAIAVDEARREMREREERARDVQQRFRDALERATDGSNAVVLGSRAYWMAGGTFCWINLHGGSTVQDDQGCRTVAISLPPDEVEGVDQG